MTDIVSPEQMYKVVHSPGFTLDKLNVHISQNFTWAEVFHFRTLYEVQQAEFKIFQNAFTQSGLLERVRAYLTQKLGRPAVMIVTSWYRSLAANLAAHGSGHSSHLEALATDFVIQGFESEDGNRYIQTLLIPFVFPARFCLELTGGKWTHVDSRVFRFVFDLNGHVLTGEEQKAFMQKWGKA